MKKNMVIAHGMLLAAALIAGFNYTISKIVMPLYASPIAIVACRGLVSIVAFSIIHYLFINEKIERSDYPRLFLASLFGIVINQISFYEGLNLSTPINASLMMTISPIIVLLISVATTKEKITLTKIAGVALGTMGAALLLIKSSNGGISKLFIGDLLVLLNAFAWGGYLVTVKPLIKKYHPITILRAIFSIGFVFVIFYGYEDIISTEWQTFTLEAWWALAFIIVFATLLAYYLNSAVLKYVEPSVAGSYIYLQPFLASTIAIAWGKDSFSLEKTSYMIFILLGVYLISIRKSTMLK